MSEENPSIFSKPDHYTLEPRGFPVFSKLSREWRKDNFPRELGPQQAEVDFFCGSDAVLAEDIVIPANQPRKNPANVFTNILVTTSHFPKDWWKETYNLGIPPNRDSMDYYMNIAWSTRSRFMQIGAPIIPLPFYYDDRTIKAYTKLINTRPGELVPVPAVAVNYTQRPHLIKKGTRVGAFYRRTPPHKGMELVKDLEEGKLLFTGQYGRDYWFIDIDENPIDLNNPDSAVAIRVNLQDNLFYIRPDDQPVQLDLSDRRLGPKLLHEPLINHSGNPGFVVGATVPMAVDDLWLVIDTGDISNNNLFTHLSSPLIHPNSKWLDQTGPNSGVKVELLTVNNPSVKETRPDHIYFFAFPQKGRSEKVSF